MPEINGTIKLVYNPYGDRAHAFVLTGNSGSEPTFSVSKTIEQGKFIQDGDTISLPLNYDEALNYNYLIAHIKGFRPDDDKEYWYNGYFFIDSYTYKNAETTEVKITLDTLETFYPFIDRVEGHLNRAHAPRLISHSEYVGTKKVSRTIINPDLYFGEDNESPVYSYPSQEYITDNHYYLCLVVRDLIIGHNFKTHDNESLYQTHLIASPILTQEERDNASIPDNSALFMNNYYTGETHDFAQSYGTIETGEKDDGTLSNWTKSLTFVFENNNDYPIIANMAVRDKSNYHCLLLDLNSYKFNSLRKYNKSNKQYEDNTDGVLQSNGSLNLLLNLGTLLQDRIVSAFAIPFNKVSSTSHPNSMRVIDKILAYRQGYIYDLSTKGTSYLLQDIRDLSIILGYNNSDSITDYTTIFTHSNGFRSLDGYSFISESGLRSFDNEKKLWLYPYRFQSLIFQDAVKKITYQDYSYPFWNISFDPELYKEYLSPIIFIDPLSPSPSFFMDSVINPNIVGYTDPDLDYSKIFNRLRKNHGWGVYTTGDEPSFQTPKVHSYMPSYAIYNNAYDSYAGYQKAIVDAQTKYQADMAQTQGTWGALAGFGSALGGGSILGAGLQNLFAIRSYADFNHTVAVPGGRYPNGRFAPHIDLPPWVTEFDPDTQIRGQMQFGTGMGSMLGGLSSAVTSIAQSVETPAYLREQQLNREMQAKNQAGQQTGGAYKGVLNYINTNFVMFRIAECVMPRDLLSIAEAKFYKMGYYIPVDIVLQNHDIDNVPKPEYSLQYVVTNKRYFCYMQFDSVSVLTIDNKELPSKSLVPTIYRNDIANRLCAGITFVNIRNNEDISTYNIDVSKDNDDLSYPLTPVFNRRWNDF